MYHVHCSRFKQDSDPVDFVEAVACEMPYYPDAHIFDGDVVFLEFDEAVLQELLGQAPRLLLRLQPPTPSPPPCHLPALTLLLLAAAVVVRV